VNECRQCGKIGYGMKRGWTMAMYCSKRCEINGVEELHASMPGCSGRWMPDHTRREIDQRWEDEERKP
jgi:hypothetical protein